jgi:hypothetical protein
MGIVVDTAVDTVVAQAGQPTVARDAADIPVADTLAAEHAVTVRAQPEAVRLPVADLAAVMLAASAEAAIPAALVVVVIPADSAAVATAVALAAVADIPVALAVVDTAAAADTGNLFTASPFKARLLRQTSLFRGESYFIDFNRRKTRRRFFNSLPRCSNEDPPRVGHPKFMGGQEWAETRRNSVVLDTVGFEKMGVNWCVSSLKNTFKYAASY